MSKNVGFTQEQIDLMNDLVENKVCVSKGEARRLIYCMPEEKLRERLNKNKVIKIVKEKK